MNPNIIHYDKQNITQEDINAVVEVLKYNYMSRESKIQEFAKYVEGKYAVAISNGTSVLHL